MLLQGQEIRYINTVTHAGKVVLFGTDSSGKIWYAVKQDGFEDSYLNTPPNERTGWEDWQELEFPNEAKDDASVVEYETKEYTYQNNTSQYILRSRYRTQDETAVAPVQLVSGMEHLYVFRQSKQNTLLCDRYVLDGIANKLVRKLQVRFKRSRQQLKPSEEMQQTAAGLRNVDSLDYRDANGQSFYEPTTELAFINNLHQGWFSIIQLPTVEHAKYRWNIFAYDSQSQKVNLYSLRVSEEGLFEVHDYSVFEPKAEDDPTLVARLLPGMIKRTLDLNVAVGNGISATKFYVQSSEETEAGPQLMRDATKVMLAVVTGDDKVASINFTALGDGTLSQINDISSTETLRSNIREVLLPLNTLDNIKSIGIAEPPPEGTIASFNRTIVEGVPLVQVTSPEATVLQNGQEIAIEGTSAYNGHYTITKIDETTFEIDAPWVENGNANSQLGRWQVVPPQEQAVVFDGIITQYAMTAEGKLRVTAENHGLDNGDEVQIFDTISYDGRYPITKLDDRNFTINDLRWQTGEAVNLKMQSQKRRGIVFDGRGDYISLPDNPALQIETYTVEVWIKPQQGGSVWQGIIGKPGRNFNIWFNASGSIHHHFHTSENWSDGIDRASNIIQWNQWNHVAITNDGTTAKTYINGELQVSGTVNGSLIIDRTPLYIGRSLDGNNSDFFKGEIADARIWKVARTEQDIKNSMYLQLTGKELDLVGYWRLGGIAVDDDSNRHVIDFSMNQNDATVYGDCYVSAVTLNRKLGDETTDVVQYSNKQLFAVTQQATYEESIEFQVNPSHPKSIAFDGVGDRIQLNFNEPETEVTRELWFKTSDPHAGLVGVSSTQGGHDRHLYLQAGNLYTRVWNNEIIQTTGLNLADGQWHHIAHVMGSSIGGQRLYVDGKLAASGNKTQSDFHWQDRISLAYSHDIDKYLNGELQEFRIWNVARTEVQIQETMSQTLKGNEANLVGYWRLDAIDNNTVTNLVDGNNNHQVLGNPTVREGSDGAIFNFSYWGQKTHRSRDRISFPGDVTRIEPAAEAGWYVAFCRFTVPQEVNLVRCFELSEISGSWETLKLRKHHIRKISDVITQATYTDPINLSPLGSSQAAAFSQLAQLQQKELEEQTFLKKKVELEAQLATLNAAPDKQTAINNKQQEIDRQQTLIRSLEGEVGSKYTAYQNEQNNLFNYWCKISSRYEDNNSIRMNAGPNYESDGQPYRLKNTPYWYDDYKHPGFQNWDIQYFKFEPVGDYYTLICKYENRIIEFPTNKNTWDLFGVTNHEKTDNQLWRLIPIPDGYYKIQCKWDSKTLDWYTNGNTIIGYDEDHSGTNQQWKIEKIGNGIPINDTIINSQ